MSTLENVNWSKTDDYGFNTISICCPLVETIKVIKKEQLLQQETNKLTELVKLDYRRLKAFCLETQLH